MIRCFYLDPLAAAWMAKHFGMRFQVIGKDADDVTDLHFDFAEDLGRISWTGYQHVNIYVHPDSGKLLKVELGDIVSMTKAMDRYAVVNAEELRDAFNETGDYKIIQRRGIPFFWPEQESEAA